MRATRFVIKGAASIFAVAIAGLTWRASMPPASYRASARVAIVTDAASSMADELASLEQHAVAGGVAAYGIDGTNVLEVVSIAHDPVTAAHSVNAALDAYVRTQQQKRISRGVAMLEETRAALRSQAAHVRDLDRRLDDSRTRLAWLMRDRRAAPANLETLGRSLARTSQTLAALEPLMTYLSQGHPADGLPVVRNSLVVQALKGCLAMLDGQRAALMVRHGPDHPNVERNIRDRDAVNAQLMTEIQNVVRVVTEDYEAARREEQWLARDREKVIRSAAAPMPSRGEYLSAFRHVEFERAALVALEQRERELAELARTPGPGVRSVQMALPAIDTTDRFGPLAWGRAADGGRSRINGPADRPSLGADSFTAARNSQGCECGCAWRSDKKS